MLYICHKLSPRTVHFHTHKVAVLQVFYFILHLKKGIHYVNLIEIGPVVIEIRGVEKGKLADSLNNTLVYHTAFSATDTRLCVLI